jgi:hypothetical protein
MTKIYTENMAKDQLFKKVTILLQTISYKDSVILRNHFFTKLTNVRFIYIYAAKWDSYADIRR